MCGKSENNSKNKINCQCDGNCDCGKILPNGDISCDNCGWKAPEAYNSLTGNNVCPSCRTESSYAESNNNVKLKNKNMNNQSNQTRDNLSNGLVGLATANAGFLNWSDTPLGKSPVNGVNAESNFTNGLVGLASANPGFLNWSETPIGKSPVNGVNAESNFAENISSQNMVGFAIGQEAFVLNPFGKGGAESGFNTMPENEMSENELAAMFYANTQEFDAESQSAEESGMGGNLGNFIDKVRNTKITPVGILMRDVWSGKYCKSLGYARKGGDKAAFKKCKNATKINFVKAKKGQWTYPASPEGVEEVLTPDQLAVMTASEVAAMPPSQVDVAAQRTGDAPAKSNMMMYGIIAFVALIIIIAIILIVRRMNKAKTA